MRRETAQAPQFALAEGTLLPSPQNAHRGQHGLVTMHVYNRRVPQIERAHDVVIVVRQFEVAIDRQLYGSTVVGDC